MKTIPLSENHKRAVAASLMLIEKIIFDFISEITYQEKKIMTTISETPAPEDINRYKIICNQALAHIAYLKEKYELQPVFFSHEQIINAMKSKIWETINDTTSKKLKRFGDFSDIYAKEFDNDFEKLQNILESF